MFCYTMGSWQHRNEAGARLFDAATARALFHASKKKGDTHVDAQR